MWPIQTFLVAETLRLREETFEAQTEYRSLVEWAASDPCGDGWGADGIAVVALWRWIAILGTFSDPDHKTVGHLIELWEKLQNTLLPRGMFYSSSVSALPQIKDHGKTGDSGEWTKKNR